MNHEPLITAAPEPKWKHDHSLITLIVGGEVHRIPVKDEGKTFDEYYDVMMEHWEKHDDVYVSLENRNGVLIRQGEKRDGFDITAGA